MTMFGLLIAAGVIWAAGYVAGWNGRAKATARRSPATATDLVGGAPAADQVRYLADFRPDKYGPVAS